MKIRKSDFLFKIVLVVLFWSFLPALGVALVSCRTINDQEVELKKRQQIEALLTLLENKNNMIPLDRLDTLRIAAISVGSESVTEFQHMLANYMKVFFFNLPADFTPSDLAGMQAKLKDFNLIIAGIHHVSNAPEFAELINFLNLKTSVISYFCKPEILDSLKISGNP
ncbi:MAG: hypothetical protein Q7J86_05560, partial [Bacteroidota bacterium]|nr:hypothetical protein [Bacteroidota bacterium]